VRVPNGPLSIVATASWTWACADSDEWVMDFLS
jgi:hypothetical protein